MGANARRTAIAVVSTVALVLSMGGVASARRSRTVVQPTLTLNAFPFGRFIQTNGVYDNVSPACLGPDHRLVVVLVNGGFGAVGGTHAGGFYSIVVYQLNRGHGDGNGGDGGGGEGNHGNYWVQSLVGGRVVGGYGHTTICLNAASRVVKVHFPGH